MGPVGRQISQEAFDDLVRENIEDFGMDFEEAAEDAVKTLTMQGADLSGIMTNRNPAAGEHPAVQTARLLNDLLARLQQDETGSDTALGLTSDLRAALQSEPDDVSKANLAAVAGRAGATDAAVEVTKWAVDHGHVALEEASLRLLQELLSCDENRAAFFRSSGPSVLSSLLSRLSLEEGSSSTPASAAAAVIAAACCKFEANKAAFVEASAYVALLDLLKGFADDSDVVVASCSAICSLCLADDTRVEASETFANARKVAAAGGVTRILEAAKSTSNDVIVMSSLLRALEAISVNEDICRSVAHQGGISFVLSVLKQSLRDRNGQLTLAACCLLSQLSGSDGNKVDVVNEGGFPLLLESMKLFADDAPVVSQVMSVVTSLTLRKPEHAQRVVELGALDVVMDMLETKKAPSSVFRKACLMLRNFVSRNPENRTKMIDGGFEALLRRYASLYPSAKGDASAVLRDMGIDNYLLK